MNLMKKDGSLYVGRDFEGNQFYLGKRDVKAHTQYIGRSGSGKSKLLELEIRQNMLNPSVGTMVVDPHGSLIKNIKMWLTKNQWLSKRVIFFDPKNPDCPGFNPIPSDSKNYDFLADTLLSATMKVWKDDQQDYPRVTRWLYNFYYLLLVSNLKFTDLEKLTGAQGKGYRKELLDNKNLPSSVKSDFLDLEKNNASRLMELLEGLGNRLRPFLNSQAVRRVLSHDSPIDLFDIMEQKKVLLIDLNGENTFSSEISRFLGTLILNDVHRVSKTRNPDKNPAPFFVYVDEFSNFTTREIAQSLAESRKFSVFYRLAHQSLTQLKDEDEYLLSSVLGNTANKVVFGGLSSEDLDIMVKELFTGFLDPKKIKFEQLVTKVRHLEEKRIVISKSMGNSKTLNKSTSQNKSISNGVSLGSSKSISESQNKGFTRGTGQNISQSNTISKGVNEGQTEGNSNTKSKGISKSIGKSESQGVNSTTSSGESRGTNKGESRTEGVSESNTIGQSTSSGTNSTKSNSQTIGRSWGESMGNTRSDGFTTTNGTSNTNTSSTGQSQSFSESKTTGESKTNSESRSDSRSTGSGYSDISSRNTGTSMNFHRGYITGDSRSQGHNMGSTVSESWNESHGSSMGTTEGTSKSQTTGQTNSRNSGFSNSESTSESRSHSQSKASTSTTSKSSSDSQSFGDSIGNSESKSNSTSKTKGTNQSKSSSKGESFTKTNSESKGESHIKGQSITNGENSSQSMSQNLSQSKSISTSQSNGFTRGFSENISDSISQSKGLTIGENKSTSISNAVTRGESEAQSTGTNEGFSISVVPFQRPEEYREVSSTQFYTFEEQLMIMAGLMKNLKPGEAVFKIGQDRPRFLQVHYIPDAKTNKIIEKNIKRLESRIKRQNPKLFPKALKKEPEKTIDPAENLENELLEV